MAWLWVVGGTLILLLVIGGAFLGQRLGARSGPKTSAATSFPAVTPAPALGATRVRGVDGAVMVYVPAGDVLMGSTDREIEAIIGECDGCKREWFDSELPQHKVFLDAYWIDRTEVTNAQYRQCVEAGACSPPKEARSQTRDSYYGNPEYDDYPVVNVTWYQARAYAEWVDGQLPTEAEWEYAARGPEGRLYPWGDRAPDESLLNYAGNVGDTTKVGLYPEGQSWCGALDMSGNVAEWTQSKAADYPYDPLDGREDLRGGEARVLRGGSVSYSARAVRCAYRLNSPPDVWYWSHGFRIVRAAFD